MKKTLLLLAASVACAFPALAQKTYTLTSPDGRLRTTVAAGDALTYAVTLDGRPILDASPLSLTLDNGTTWGIAPRVAGVSRTSVDTAIPSPFYSSAEVRDRYNGLTLKMRGDWSVEFRTYDEGIAPRQRPRQQRCGQQDDDRFNRFHASVRVLVLTSPPEAERRVERKEERAEHDGGDPRQQGVADAQRIARKEQPHDACGDQRVEQTLPPCGFDAYPRREQITRETGCIPR